MPTKRTATPLVSITCKHTCADGQHALIWQEGDANAANYAFTANDFKHGPYCHWCGECLEEEAVATE